LIALTILGPAEYTLNDRSWHGGFSHEDCSAQDARIPGGNTQALVQDPLTWEPLEKNDDPHSKRTSSRAEKMFSNFSITLA